MKQKRLILQLSTRGQVWQVVRYCGWVYGNFDIGRYLSTTVPYTEMPSYLTKYCNFHQRILHCSAKPKYYLHFALHVERFFGAEYDKNELPRLGNTACWWKHSVVVAESKLLAIQNLIKYITYWLVIFSIYD